MTASIVIASAARTAFGSFNGSFANTPAHELGAAVIRGLLERLGVGAAEVDEVILGQVLSAGEGQNPARQAAMKAGIPQDVNWGKNQLCGSGLRAVAIGMQQIATADAKIIVAGGMESMSMAPHCAHLRGGVKVGDFKVVDTMIKDGINDGAAAALLMTEEEAGRRGIQPLARVVSWAAAGVDAQVLGTGPIPAYRKALEKAGWKMC